LLVLFEQRALELFAQITREIDEGHGLGFCPEAPYVCMKLISLVATL